MKKKSVVYRLDKIYSRRDANTRIFPLRMVFGLHISRHSVTDLIALVLKSSNTQLLWSASSGFLEQMGQGILGMSLFLSQNESVLFSIRGTRGGVQQFWNCDEPRQLECSQPSAEAREHENCGEEGHDEAPLLG